MVLPLLLLLLFLLRLLLLFQLLLPWDNGVGDVHLQRLYLGYRTIEKILWSDDRHYTIRYDVSSPIFDVGVFEGEIVGIVDGNEFKAPVKVERKSPDEFVYISKSADGDEVEVVFRKVDRSKRKRAKGKS